MRAPILSLALAPLLMAAANPDDFGDAQCLIAYGQLGSSEDAATRTAGLIGAQYYLGRLDGRGAASDLRGLLKQAGEAMKPADLKPTLDRCGARLQQRTQALQAVGQALAKEAPAIQ